MPRSSLAPNVFVVLTIPLLSEWVRELQSIALPICNGFLKCGEVGIVVLGALRLSL